MTLPRVVLVTTVGELARELKPRPAVLKPADVAAFAERPVFVFDARTTSNLFEALPEKTQPTPASERVMDWLEALSEEVEEQLIELHPDAGDDEWGEDGWEWGFHPDATAAKVSSHFRNEKFEVKKLKFG